MRLLIVRSMSGLRDFVANKIWRTLIGHNFVFILTHPLRLLRLLPLLTRSSSSPSSSSSPHHPPPLINPSLLRIPLYPSPSTSSDMSSSSDSSPAKSVKSDTKSETPPPALPRRSYAEVFFNYKSDRLEPVTASNWFVPTDSEAARLKQDSTESKDDSPAQPTARAYTRRLIPRKYIP